MFMQPVGAGDLLLISTRAQECYFQRPFHEWGFFSAIMGAQVFAALMAAYGWLVAAISRELMGFVWIYNVVWLIVLDLVKSGWRWHLAMNCNRVEPAYTCDQRISYTGN